MTKVSQAVQEPAYKFRTLNSTDMFLMFKILSKIGVHEFADALEGDVIQGLVARPDGEDGEDRSTAVGIAVMLRLANVVLANLPKCEAEIYQMLANVSDLTVKQVREMDFVTFTEMVVDFIKKDEFRDFISVVSRLFK